MSDLKPCPFCGVSNCEIVSNGHDSQFVECMFCGASGPAHETHDETVEAWNQRAQPAQAGQVLTDDEVALIVAECAASAHRQDDFSFARAIEQAVLSKRVPTKLWLWKNFVNGRPEYWAFDNAFPVHLNCGDPQTLGEPCGYALFKPSRNACPEVSDAEVLRRVGIAGEKGGA